MGTGQNKPRNVSGFPSIVYVALPVGHEDLIYRPSQAETVGATKKNGDESESVDDGEEDDKEDDATSVAKTDKGKGKAERQDTPTASRQHSFPTMSPTPRGAPRDKGKAKAPPEEDLSDTGRTPMPSKEGLPEHETGSPMDYSCETTWGAFPSRGHYPHWGTPEPAPTPSSTPTAKGAPPPQKDIFNKRPSANGDYPADGHETGGATSRKREVNVQYNRHS